MPHSVDWIDIIGDSGVVMGMKDDNLKFSSIELISQAQLRDTYSEGKAAQGELRSHIFLQRENGGGILRLLIIRTGQSY